MTEWWQEQIINSIITKYIVGAIIGHPKRREGDGTTTSYKSHPSDEYVASSPQGELCEIWRTTKSLSLRRGVTIVTEWWQTILFKL